jgi:sugar phosphate isomerase/epimerase
MRYRLTALDYSFDWAMKDRNMVPRSKPGYLSREEIVAFCGTLGVNGIELNHPYWEDYSAVSLRQLTSDAGLPVVCYVFSADLALSKSERQASLDLAYSMLDRTAELGASLAMIIPTIVKPNVSLEQQRIWLIDGLRQCSERALSVGVTLLTENIDYPPVRPLMGSGIQCRNICAEVDSPALRLIYDVGAPLFVDEDSLAALREMADYVVHVHLKSARPVTGPEPVERYLDSVSGKRYIGTVLDGGILNIESLLAELDALAYKGYFCIEYQGVDDPRKAMEHNIKFLRRVGEKSAKG